MGKLTCLAKSLSLIPLWRTVAKTPYLKGEGSERSRQVSWVWPGSQGPRAPWPGGIPRRSGLDDPGLQPGPPGLRSADDEGVALRPAHQEHLQVRQGSLQGAGELAEPQDLLL